MGAISRVFKSATRAVKKVTSGVTKAAKKIGKGIAKIGKSVWNGVKQIGGKAFELYGKVSGKLGPIGMIGLSMAMPYLMPGFTGTAGGLWTKFGAKMGVKATATQAGFGWANHATNPFLRVIGQVGGNIYKGTNFIKGTAQGISQTIGKTFEGFASEGTLGSKISSGFSNLYKGTTEVLTGQAGKGTMIPTQFKDALGTTVNKNLLNVKAGLESSQFAAFNPDTLLQTGGIELGNMNIANKFTYDVTSAAMRNAKVFNNFSDEANKYLNTLRKVGVDDNTAYEYLKQNGIVNGQLDKSLSADFVYKGSPMSGGYEFTGDNLRSSFKNAEYNYNMKFTKPKIEGDVFAQPDSLLKPQGVSKSKDFASAALSNALTLDQGESVDGYKLAMGIKSEDPNSTITGTGGTSGAYVKTGSLLNDAQLAFFQKQNLDIA